MPVRKKYFGCSVTHSWTFCITSSLLRNIFPPRCRRDNSLREQGPDYMEDVIERSISVSGWCPWCEQPRVDWHYPGEMTQMFAPFFSCSWWLSLLGLREVPSNIQSLLCDALWGNPVLPNEWIDAVTLFARYGSSRPALTRVILHLFPSFSKRTATLIDTNIWQCLLTILPLQSWTGFRRFTTFFLQESDYNALFHVNVYLRFAYLPHNWQNCAAANTRSFNDLGTVLPRSTYYNFQRTALRFWTTNQL